MIFPDTPEARREIDRRLDPDNFIEEDSCRKHGDLLDLSRIMLRSIRAMSEVEKAEIRAHLTKVLSSKGYGQLSLTVEDKSLLHRIGVRCD